MLLLERTTLKAGEVADLVHVFHKVDGRKTRVGLRRADFEAVATAGNGLFRIGQADPSQPGPGRTVKEAQFTLHLPGHTPADRLEYHNRLMMLCQVSLREVTQAIASCQSKAGLAPRAPAPACVEPAPAAGDADMASAVSAVGEVAPSAMMRTVGR